MSHIYRQLLQLFEERCKSLKIWALWRYNEDLSLTKPFNLVDNTSGFSAAADSLRFEVFL